MTNRNPVVFVHGNGDSAEGWQRQISRFEENGCTDDEFFAITLDPPQNESNIHYANQLKLFMEDVLQKTGASKIDLVAHSLGCTVSRHYIKFMGGSRIVEHAVLISGGNHGLPAADLTLGQPEEFKQSPELTTMGSQFLDDLNTGNEGDLETFGPTKYMTISGPHDEFYLFNPESPQLKGADNRIIKNHGHFGLRDAEESFACVLAFFQDRAESLDIGRDVLGRPAERPLGSWIIIGGSGKGDQYTFHEDGSYEGEENGEESRGTYIVDASGYPCKITLRQTRGLGGTGERLGIYQVNVTDRFLRLALGELNSGEIPGQMVFERIYERKYESDAIPEDYIGIWKTEELGFCAAAGWTSGELEILGDGRYVLRGENILSPVGKFEISGKLAVSFKPDPPHLTMEFVTIAGDIPFFIPGEVLPGIFKREANRLEMQWGSAMFGIPRPACMDSPVVFVRKSS